MRTFLFWTSLFCTTLVGIFMWTNLSLNGYKTDFYFFLVTLLLNLICFWILYRGKKTRRQSIINFSLAALQIIGLCIFLWADTLQVDKVYEPRNTKYNLYSSLSGWYKRSYYKQHQAELCNDGELWETKVPTYFPVIEIETSRDRCHKVGIDSNYAWLYRHIPE
jgi:hypothetical protein